MTTNGAPAMTRDPQTPSYYLSRDGQDLDLTPLAAPLPYFLGAALKYLCRAGRKPGVPASEDLLKAARCAKLAVEHSWFQTWGAALESLDVLRDAEIWCHPDPFAQTLWQCLMAKRVWPTDLKEEVDLRAYALEHNVTVLGPAEPGSKGDQ